MNGPNPLLARLLAAGLLALAGCSDDPPAIFEITEVRAFANDTAPPPTLDATSAERFGFTRRGEPDEARDFFLWVTPPGWEELPPTPIRLLNFRAGAAECYLSQVASTDVIGNVNRWRTQMDLPPLSPEDVDALPQTTLLTQPAIAVDVAGTFTDMDGTARPGSRMLARFGAFPTFAMTVKLIGPADAVAAEAVHFTAFCDSLGFDMAALDSMSDQTTNTPSGAAEAARVPGLEPEPPAGEVPADDAPAATAAAPLAWDLPDGWTAGGPSGMRLATFAIADAPRTECYVTVLPGTAGGVAANVNRWRAEMQSEPLTDAELASLPTRQVLGVAAPFIEIEGTYKGMRGEAIEEALMLGLVCPLAAETLFVKLIGPADEARAARPAFVAFCESLR